MAKLGGFVTFLYFLALVAGVIALFMPFWVSTGVDVATRTVVITKRTQSGLWWSKETFEIKDGSIADLQNETSWEALSDTPLNTGGLKAIKGVIIIGLGCLLVAMFIAGCTRCCSDDDNKFRMQTVFCGTGIAAIIAGVFIAIGPIVYYTDVKSDYNFEGKDLEWCFWLAVSSACAAIAAGILGMLGCLFSFRQKRSLELK